MFAGAVPEAIRIVQRPQDLLANRREVPDELVEGGVLVVALGGSVLGAAFGDPRSVARDDRGDCLQVLALAIAEIAGELDG